MPEKEVDFLETGWSQAFLANFDSSIKYLSARKGVNSMKIRFFPQCIFFLKCHVESYKPDKTDNGGMHMQGKPKISRKPELQGSCTQIRKGEDKVQPLKKKRQGCKLMLFLLKTLYDSITKNFTISKFFGISRLSSISIKFRFLYALEADSHSYLGNYVWKQ